MTTFGQLDSAFKKAKNDPSFWQEYEQIMSTYSCRPTPLTFAENLTRHFGGACIYIKREDLNHTGAHKANNVMGQGLLVKRMGKTSVIAETGAGQHGVATATMAAKLGFKCTIYMGEVDIARQRPNVFWMERLGAEVIPVKDGTRVLKDAINEAFRDWVTNMDDTHYVLALPAVLIRSPKWSLFSSQSSAKRRADKSWRLREDCLIECMPAWAADPMPWEFSAVFLMIL